MLDKSVYCIPITVNHPVQETLIDYHGGQGDVLYHVLSRAFAEMDTGRSLRYEVTINASLEEINRLLDVCSEVEDVDPYFQEKIDDFVLHLLEQAYPDKLVECPACLGKGCMGCEGTGKQQAVYRLLDGSYVAYNPTTGQEEYVD